MKYSSHDKSMRRRESAPEYGSRSAGLGTVVEDDGTTEVVLLDTGTTLHLRGGAYGITCRSNAGVGARVEVTYEFGPTYGLYVARKLPA